jgi:6-phosphogluconolactonase
MRALRRRARWALLLAVVSGPMMASPARAATFVYVGNADSNEIYVLQLDRQRGDLTLVEKVAIPGIEKPGNSTPMALSPDRRVLYVGTRGEPKVAAGFKVDPANGTLSPIGSVPTEKQPRGFNIDSSGRYLLAVGQLSHSLSSYSIDPASGKLTKLKEYPMGRNPNWVEIVDLP